MNEYIIETAAAAAVYRMYPPHLPHRAERSVLYVCRERDRRRSDEVLFLIVIFSLFVWRHSSVRPSVSRPRAFVERASRLCTLLSSVLLPYGVGKVVSQRVSE